MEIASRHSFSSIPLTTVPPRQVNTRSVSSNRSPQSASEDQSKQQKLEQQQNQATSRVIQQLVSRDREVRAHEAAHVAVGGQYITGGPSFTYQQGPDGRSYAIGGEVNIDTSAVPDDPQATLNKADKVRRAALAPSQPSPQDLRVASRASQTAVQARIEIAVLRAEAAEQAQQEKSEALQVEEGVANQQSEGIAADNPVSQPSALTAAPAKTDNLTAIQSFEPEQPQAVSVSLFA